MNVSTGHGHESSIQQSTEETGYDGSMQSITLLTLYTHTTIKHKGLKAVDIKAYKRLILTYQFSSQIMFYQPSPHPVTAVERRWSWFWGCWGPPDHSWTPRPWNDTLPQQEEQSIHQIDNPTDGAREEKQEGGMEQVAGQTGKAGGPPKFYPTGVHCLLKH